MRRDVQYLYHADAVSVYNAFLTSAKNEPFDRDCSEEPFCTISFGLNFSMKYNMNGGSCIINFFPTEGNTLVNMRFVIAQAMGARYKKYADDLTEYVNRMLGTMPEEVEFEVDDLLKTAPRITPESFAKPVCPQAEVCPAVEDTTFEAPVCEEVTPPAENSAPVSSFAPAFCSNCGNKLGENDAFCGMCGKKVAPTAKFCTNCGKQVPIGDAFCRNCGSKL